MEHGFDHKILGELRVRAVKAPTYKERGPELDCSDDDHQPAQKDVFAQLKSEAFKHGANAVIYAYSNVSQSPTLEECTMAVRESDFGRGQAVFVVEKVNEATGPTAPLHSEQTSPVQ